jgi:hypothetical protein
MLTPVVAGDGMTVALSTDRTFASGDIILSVGADRLDPSVKTPLRDVLMKHGPTELVSVKVRRSDAELTVTAACKDARPFYDAAFEAALAASKGDAATCYDKLVEAGRLEALHSGFLNLEFICGVQAGRIVTPTDQASGYYEIVRRMILENAWSADALGAIRATILTDVDTLKKSNAGYLGDDLKSQYDQAVAASSRPK